MARQINFFLAAEDEAPFEAALRSVGPFLIIRDRGPAAVPDTIATTTVVNMGVDALTVLLVRANDLSETRMQRMPGRFEYAVDEPASPVIEYSRCFRTETVIRRGRLYFSAFHYAGAQKIMKSEQFVAWADTVLNKARRWLLPTDNDALAGPEAKRLAARGVELKQF